MGQVAPIFPQADSARREWLAKKHRRPKVLVLLKNTLEYKSFLRKELLELIQTHSPFMPFQQDRAGPSQETPLGAKEIHLRTFNVQFEKIARFLTKMRAPALLHADARHLDPLPTDRRMKS